MSADPAHSRIGHLQAGAVARRPDQLFIEGRHQLAVMDQNLAVSPISRFEFQRPPALAGERSLMPIETVIPSARASARSAYLGAVDQHRLLRHADEQVVVVDRRPQRGPDRKGGDVGFGKRDQPRAGVGCLTHERDGLFGGRLAIEKYRRGMDGGGLEAGKHGIILVDGADRYHFPAPRV